MTRESLQMMVVIPGPVVFQMGSPPTEPGRTVMGNNELHGTTGEDRA